jgi:hypothetical protein
MPRYAVCCFLCALPSISMGQTVTASIVGTVADTTGSPNASAAAKLMSEDTRATRNVLSDSSGDIG